MNFQSNFSAPFIRRPVATSLITIAIFLSGVIAFRYLPVAPLPQVDLPTIGVWASLPGASPETMASAVATPLERQFGRISGVTQMTSSSSLGSTGIALQFDLNRDINAAARDVEAAINAARSQLPADLPYEPEYRKVNTADSPVMFLSLTSDTLPIGQIYDASDSILAQKIAQIPGVGQVFTWGSAKPAVRVRVNPEQLNSYGISLETVRKALQAANSNLAKGGVSNDNREWVLADSDQLFDASEYKSLIVAGHAGAPVRLEDVASVTDSVEDIRNLGLFGGKRGVIVAIFRQPGANMIDTADRVKATLPWLRASISPALNLSVMMDRTVVIRSSVHDVERAMTISIVLVVLVVFAFLRNYWATLIPGVAVPLSLVGTFGVMYLCGYSLDNLSLMALTISTGFVVDDAIVVIENIARHMENGLQGYAAAMKGASEIGFTVLSMSASLVAVFIPILLMGGLVGRLFREFAVTLSAAIAVSLFVSLTATPMMCARFLKHDHKKKHGFFYRIAEGGFNDMLHRYDVMLRWVLRNQLAILCLTIFTAGLSVFMFVHVNKGFFPQQDTGRINGYIQADQDTSFEEMSKKMRAFMDIVKADPAIDTVTSFTGGGNGTSTARMFAQLKPLSVRKVDADQVIDRLRSKTANIPGASLFLQSVQDVSVGGRWGGAQYQYTLQADNLDDLYHWAPIMMERMQQIPELRDINSDEQNGGLQTYLAVDRDTAGRLGVSLQDVDNALNDAFGQRQVSNIYKGLNQYHVVMEVAPEFQENPQGLKNIYVPSNTGRLVPLSALSHYEHSNAALSVNHQGIFPAITISFNLTPGASLGPAVQHIEEARAAMGMPNSVHASFQGTAEAFQQSLANQPILILTALGAVYIVLGILYESYIHPITILSTIPSAGIGALLALELFHMDLSIIALIGIILLIGIVKKNAILMIDFAVQTEREEEKTPVEAIYKACLLRFRPIMMTTMAALLGATPLALGTGVGSEIRRPLGVAIVGGLILSQMLTLFTTPVVYIYMDRLQTYLRRTLRRGWVPRHAPAQTD
ncbi:MAG TPA: multidrug efflux RND transporter permease subunit [Candidatus Eremiobacteraceae bacterium]|nr:multidrug efflux RND transporter permease subunit [Candidatus Eremiobacteraceae bacterium]